jgi:pectate lyase
MTILLLEYRVSQANTHPSRNIAVTDINPQYVWGGDGITINEADQVWIDHVTVCIFPPPLYKPNALVA